MNDTQKGAVVGIAWMLATMLCFITLDAFMKYGLETYSLVQVTWARFFFATVFAMAWCLRDIRRVARSKNLITQVLRSVLLMVTTVLFNAAISTVPLATATTVMFLSPIFVTMLSVIVLGEIVGWRRWAGIALGLLGAITIVNPWNSESGSQYGIALLFCAALTNACYQIATRYARADDPATSLLYTAALGAIVSSIILPSHWSWPSTGGWGVLVACGALGAIGHFFLIRAYRAAPASVVAPFAYSSLIWATIFGYAIWNEWPAANVWVGAALIIAAGLYIFFREMKADHSGGSVRFRSSEK